MFTKRYPQLWKILAGPRYRNMGLFALILFPNFFAAIFEGISFALILAALSIIAGQQAPSLGTAWNTFQGYLPHSPNMQFVSLILISVAFQAIRSAIGGIAFYANSVLSLRIQAEAQLKIYQKIFSLSYSSVSQYKIGDLAEYAKTPATMINVIMDSANKVLVSLFMVLSILVVMTLLHIKLTLLTLFLLGITGFLHKAIIKKIARSSETLTRHVVDCSKQTMQILQSMRTIHTYHRQNHSFNTIRQILNNIIDLSKKVYLWSNFIPSINELLGTLLVTIILLAGIIFLSDQKESMLPILITFLALTHRLAIRIQNGNASLGHIVTHKGSILRLEEILSDEGKEFAPTDEGAIPKFYNDIEFDKVDLHYPSSIKPAIHQVSLKILKGKTIAFVGASGAGKSSILDLLVRLYEPTSGSIRIDGVDLRNYSIQKWRNMLGVVSQDIFIFNDSVEENIRFGLTHHSIDEIIHASHQAGLDEFVRTLPDGYATIVGERGFRLSGGQRQRLALARALVRNPQLLILDEATSNLDTKSESCIQSALEKLRGQRTILIVAHRLSTVMSADWIYVLQQGRIAEEGQHNHLLKTDGAYASFWKMQIQKEI